MEKRIVVVVGAGASAGLRGVDVGSVDTDYEPPVTNNIFSHRQSARILSLFPGANALAATIAIEVSRGKGLEATLRELKDSGTSPTKEQFREIPLFLQALFAEISAKYTTLPVNYSSLVERLLRSGFEQVAFVTPNYDLFLEQVLATSFLGGPIGDLNSYIDRDRWLLVKVHGSVDWGWPLTVKVPKPDPWADESWRNSYLQVLRDSDLDHIVDSSDVRFVENYGKPTWRDDDPWYPALSVPLGEYDFVCPPSHIERLSAYLEGCRNVLVIGVSGKDKEILDLLSTSLPETLEAFTLVDNLSEPLPEETAYGRFTQAVPQLLGASHLEHYYEGFSRFIQNGRLDEFITSCG